MLMCIEGLIRRHLFYRDCVSYRICVCMYLCMYVRCTLSLIIAFGGRKPYYHVKECVLFCRAHTDFRIRDVKNGMPCRRGVVWSKRLCSLLPSSVER